MQEAVRGVALGPSVNMQTAAQKALAIPEILENILLRASFASDPTLVRDFRLVGRLWRDTMDGVLLNRVCFDSVIGYYDVITIQPLDLIIDGRGGFSSIRSLVSHQLPEQLPLGTGLTSLVIDLDDLLSRGSHAHPLILPNLRRLDIRIYSSREVLSPLELQDLLHTKGSASLHLRLDIQVTSPTADCCGALCSIAGKFEQSLESLALSDTSCGGGKQTFEIVRELLPTLSHLRRLMVAVNVVPSIMRLNRLTLPPLLRYIEVKCSHLSPRGFLHMIATIADSSVGANFYPFVLRCGTNDGYTNSQLLKERRAEAAQEAITAWKEKRGIEVPEIVAQSWLECECKYW